MNRWADEDKAKAIAFASNLIKEATTEGTKPNVTASGCAVVVAAISLNSNVNRETFLNYMAEVYDACMQAGVLALMSEGTEGEA